MDDARKSRLEKGIFIGLVVVFGVGLVSMLQSFWHAPARPPVVQTPTRPLPEAATSAASQELSPHAELVKTSDAGERPPIQYTASDFRDPLVSLLPKPEVESPAAGGAAETRAVETPVAPAVHVEGMFWGLSLIHI